MIDEGITVEKEFLKPLDIWKLMSDYSYFHQSTLYKSIRSLTEEEEMRCGALYPPEGRMSCYYAAVDDYDVDIEPEEPLWLKKKGGRVVVEERYKIKKIA